jgi:hypothetical protein
MLSQNQIAEAEAEAVKLFKRGKAIQNSKFYAMSINCFPAIKKIVLEQHEITRKKYLDLQNQPITKKGKK